MNALRTLAKSPILPLSLIAVGCAGWTVTRADSDARVTSPASSDGVFFMHALEENSAPTVPDWAGAADVVVEARVVSERAVELPRSETDTKEGLRPVGRDITVEVIDVIWRSPDATVASPKTFDMAAWGWMRVDASTKREMVTPGAARLETGHTYVMALEWREAQCEDGDEPVPAQWTAIGSGAVLPADGDTIGVGEYEGSHVDLVDDISEPQAEVMDESALGEFVGDEPAALADALDDAADDTGLTTSESASTCDL